MPLTYLHGDHFVFPHPERADEQGLLAAGGDLSPAHLLDAYSHGIFPWYEPGYPILWWSPNPRLILKPDQFKLTRSLKQSLNHSHRLTIDTQFAAVMEACASVDERVGNTWITPEMREAYYRLYQLGYGHSFEIWMDEQLVGGLYGLSLGRAFFGESMFHYQRDASKMALYYLCQTLGQWQFDFIDCQLPTPHLEGLGAVTMPRKAFLQCLEDTLKYPTRQGRWEYPPV